MITKTLNDYATEISMVNANFCSTYFPSEIYDFTLEALRILICNRIMNNNIVKMEQKDINILIGFIMEFSDAKMIAYRDALVKYSEVLHC
nr:MAG TPA: hypothetical protein [Ackermannviridae sp.]